MADLWGLEGSVSFFMRRSVVQCSADKVEQFATPHNLAFS